jgi:hydroxymethylpyrimidine pyrophosphatase-like HAD family hydrolase
MGVRSVNVKAIVLDLDRTLLRTDKSLSEYTVSVLKKYRQKGIAVMVATARPLRTTLPICEHIKFDAMVVSNGARILCGSQKTEYTIAPDCGTALLKSLQCQEDFRITLETGDCAYSNKPIGEYETILADDLIALVKSESIMKILVHFDREDTLERVKKVLPKELYCTVSL